MYLGSSSKTTGGNEDSSVGSTSVSQSLDLTSSSLKGDRLLLSDRDLPRRDLHKVHVEQEAVYRRIPMSGDQFPSSLSKTHASSSEWSLSSGRDYDYHHLVPSDLTQKLDSGLRETEFYHGTLKNNPDDQWQEALLIKKQSIELLSQKRGLEQEVSQLQRILEDNRKELVDIRRQQQESIMDTGGGGEAAYRQKCKALKDEYDTLHKRYADLMATHSAHVSKLELTQEELARVQKSLEESIMERNAALRERTGLQQQCTAAIRQWDNALRERNEAREQLTKVQQQRDEAMKEINQAMAVRIKASKDLSRLTEERNAAVQEYSLIMSERDSVHKEIERLQEELSESQKKTKQLETQRKASQDEVESLKREIASALQDRDRALKECNDLREKYGDFSTGHDDSSRDRDRTARKHDQHWDRAEADSTRKEREAPAREGQNKVSLGDLDQANKEIETLRRSIEKLQMELVEAQQEAEVCKRRRDWAFSERDKIVLERESIRTLCDKLRRERDRAVSDLAEALRDSDDIKRQRNEASKELKELKEKIEAQLEKESRMKQLNSVGNNHSRDSAIDTDLQEWETEVKEVTVRFEEDHGFEISGGKDDPHDTMLYISTVMKGGPADGKLCVNDWVMKVNGIEVTGMDKRAVQENIINSKGNVTMVVKRKRVTSSRGVQSVTLNLGSSKEHGLTFDTGVYISKINPGSVAAREGTLAVGDRLLSINGKPVEDLRKATESLDSATSPVLLQIAKSAPCTSSPPSSASSGHNLVEKGDTDKAAQPQGGTLTSPLKEKTFVSTSIQTDALLESKVSPNSRNKKLLAGNDRPVSISGQPTLLDKAYHKIFGDKRLSRDKKQVQPLSLMPLSAQQEEGDPIAELDSMLDHYSKSSIGKQSSSGKSKEESAHNGGTWPKYRGPPLQFSEAGTVNTLQPHKRKERKSLTSFTKQFNVYDSKAQYVDFPRPPPPSDELSSPSSGNCTSSSGSYTSPMSSSPVKVPMSTQSSERISLHYSGASVPEDCLDYSVVSAHRDKDVLEYYRNRGKQRPRSAHYVTSDAECHSPVDTYSKPLSPPPPLSRGPYSHTEVLMSTPTHMFRGGVPFYPRGHPHPHPHSLNCYPPSQGLPTYISRSGDSLLSSTTGESASVSTDPRLDSLRFSVKDSGRYSFTPSPCPSQYSYSGTSPTHSLDFPHFHPYPPPLQTSKHLVPAHSHMHNTFRPEEPYPQSFDGISTFPKRNQRILIPSTPSVTSKSSAGKVSTSSIEKAPSLPERSSPMPPFTVELLTPNGSHAITELRSRRRPKPGDMRKIVIEKSLEPLGIQINCGSGGTIFVSSVSENSLAAQVGLQVGDQLLEVCGINMRKATYQLAANVLRQCRDSITMLVQYNPDKYREAVPENGSSSDDQSPVDTPSASPKMHHSHSKHPDLVRISNDDIPSSATSTLTRQKQSSVSSKNSGTEPRLIVLRKTTSNLGISLLGGNAVGIFVHSVQDDSPASGPSGLKRGDQILEYNGADLRNATAEEAAYELARPADTVKILVQYNIDRYTEIQEQPGDSFYVRALFDRASSDGSLAFRKDDILYVDNTMYKGVPGLWNAWLIDQDGQKTKCGYIPSKYKAEEELLMKRSLLDLEGGEGARRGSTSARRSFFRRRRHQRSSSRDSKELASFSDVSINSCSDSGTLGEELLPPTYLRVEKLNYKSSRPVILVGPLMEAVVDKLEQDFPRMFQRCIPEVKRGSQQMMDRGVQELKIVDYRRRGSHFECITVCSIKDISEKYCHAFLDVSLSAVERLNRCQIYPIVIFIKFKTTKQIREVKDSRYLTEKVTTKAAKEMYEHALKIESEYKHLINAIIPGSNLAYMCTQVKMYVEDEQSKALWVPSGSL